MSSESAATSRQDRSEISSVVKAKHLAIAAEEVTHTNPRSLESSSLCRSI